MWGSYRQLLANLKPFRAGDDVHVTRVEDLRDSQPLSVDKGTIVQLTRDGSQEWLMYRRSLFRFRCLLRPI